LLLEARPGACSAPVSLAEFAREFERIDYLHT
jgi:hypothetical protein